MWQRIQTLYLLISTALVAALCFSTAYSVAGPDGLERISWWQLQKPYFGILLGILAFLVVLALVVFRSRILQMRLAVLSGIIALGMQAWVAYLYFSFEGPVFSWTAVFPLVICICNLLAARGCFQDQLVVESAYRVRERRRKKK
ncbi:MAG: DUF4293 family protein [Bacteroidales bacterium]|nr:DUF4293 family protein [Bacteroidales bacterium]